MTFCWKSTINLAMLNLPVLQWVSRDAALIISARGFRTFSQSFVAILIFFYLKQLGYGILHVGVFLSVGVAGVAFFAFIVGLIAGKIGRRRLMVTFTLVSSASALALIFAENYWALLSLAFIGGLATGGGGGGESAAQPLEMASLPDTAPTERRTELFAIYSIVARTGTALGALAAGLPILYQDSFGLSAISSYKVMFLAFAAFQLVGALLYSRLSPAVEGALTQRQWTNPLKLPSRRIIFTLTGLFSVDTFTTSMVHQSLIAAWFNTKFGLEPWQLGQVFFLSHILTAISMWVAAKLANKIGLLNTMVFTHIPSSLFFMVAVFAPTAWIAILFWQLRAFMSQMDVPTKDSYTMAIVGPEERVAMASMHMVSRSATGAFGPVVTTQIWTVFAASVPFVASAIVKIGYDLSLYALFRNVRPPEETRRRQQPATAEEPVA